MKETLKSIRQLLQLKKKKQNQFIVCQVGTHTCIYWSPVFCLTVFYHKSLKSGIEKSTTNWSGAWRHTQICRISRELQNGVVKQADSLCRPMCALASARAVSREPAWPPFVSMHSSSNCITVTVTVTAWVCVCVCGLATRLLLLLCICTHIYEEQQPGCSLRSGMQEIAVPRNGMANMEGITYSTTPELE